MFPVIEENKKRATQGGEAQAPGSTKSVVLPLFTVPVGSPPGRVTTGRAATGTTGLPPTSPENSVEVLVTLLESQKGLAPVALIPHGFTIKGSWMAATPGASETKFVWRYAEPGGIEGIFGFTGVTCCAPVRLPKRAGIRATTKTKTAMNAPMSAARCLKRRAFIPKSSDHS